MKRVIYSISILLLVSFINISVKGQAVVDMETGLVFTGYNNVRIPGNQGTLFSLKDDLAVNPQLFYRLRAAYTVKSRHTFSLLYAPLKTVSEGRVANDIYFEDAIFPANTLLKASYTFNSYRFTYRYMLVNKPKIDVGLGFTVKIRDAGIRLSSPTLMAEKNNVGFVPLINFRFWWKINDAFGLLLDGDALAAPQGRAEDVLFALSFKPFENLGFSAGYRLLEGGADGAEVYTFALFHYASLGLCYTF